MQASAETRDRLVSEACAALGELGLAELTVGSVADHYGFRPVLIGASFAPVFATAMLFWLVRNNRYSGTGVVRVL